MQIFMLLLVIYITIMYYSYNKVKDDKVELIRYRDSLVRFTFLQLSFSLYDYLTSRFDILTFFNKLMLSHIGVASFVLVKEHMDKFIIKKES